MTMSKKYNLIVKELVEDFGEESSEYNRFKVMLDDTPKVAYGAIWDEYKDKANMYCICYIVESMWALFADTTKEGLQ